MKYIYDINIDKMTTKDQVFNSPVHLGDKVIISGAMYEVKKIIHNLDGENRSGGMANWTTPFTVLVLG